MKITWSLIICIGTTCWCLLCCWATICFCCWSFCNCCCLIASCCCSLCCFNTCNAKASCCSFNCCFCLASCINCCCLNKSCCVVDKEGAGMVLRTVEFCCTTNFCRSGCWAIGLAAPGGKGLKGGTTCRVFWMCCLWSSRLLALNELLSLHCNYIFLKRIWLKVHG